MFEHLFTTYQQTDPPPIITNDHKIIMDTYNPHIAPIILPSTKYEENISFSDLYQEHDPLKIDNDQIPTVKYKDKKQEIVEQPLNDKKVESIKRVIPSNDSEFIINYFVNKGLTRIQAKGIYGNLMQESSGNIQAVSSDGHNSYGLAQWTGPRKQRLFSRYGTNPTIEQQLDFLWWELNNTHKDALLSLRRTTTVSDATRVFMNKFERPHKDYANFNRRLRFANSIA